MPIFRYFTQLRLIPLSYTSYHSATSQQTHLRLIPLCYASAALNTLQPSQICIRLTTQHTQVHLDSLSYPVGYVSSLPATLHITQARLTPLSYTCSYSATLHSTTKPHPPQLRLPPLSYFSLHSAPPPYTQIPLNPLRYPSIYSATHFTQLYIQYQPTLLRLTLHTKLLLTPLSLASVHSASP
jgi:hypothetical protein